MPKAPKGRRKKRSSADEEKMRVLHMQFCSWSWCSCFFLVPFGTGGSVINHLQNCAFRWLVNAYRPEYLALNDEKDRKVQEREKREIGKKIKDIIHLSGGKFVEWDDGHGQWVQIFDDKRLEEKAMQALRQDTKKFKEQEQPKQRLQHLKEHSAQAQEMRIAPTMLPIWQQALHPQRHWRPYPQVAVHQNVFASTNRSEPGTATRTSNGHNSRNIKDASTFSHDPEGLGDGELTVTGYAKGSLQNEADQRISEDALPGKEVYEDNDKLFLSLLQSLAADEG